MGELYVYIRYFAVHCKNGEYLGTMEVTRIKNPIFRIILTGNNAPKGAVPATQKLTDRDSPLTLCILYC
jgi:hypothetical protein